MVIKYLLIKRVYNGSIPATASYDDKPGAEQNLKMRNYYFLQNKFPPSMLIGIEIFF